MTVLVASGITGVWSLLTSWTLIVCIPGETLVKVYVFAAICAHTAFASGGRAGDVPCMFLLAELVRFFYGHDMNSDGRDL